MYGFLRAFFSGLADKIMIIWKIDMYTANAVNTPVYYREYFENARSNYIFTWFLGLEFTK